MTGTILRCRTLRLAALALLVAGCSSTSSTSTGEGSGSSGGASSGAPSGASSGGGAMGGSGSGAGASSGDDASSGGGSSSGSMAGDDEDAASSPGPRDAAARDAASHDAAGGDAATGSGDGGDPLAAARAQCVQIINQDRATLNPPSPALQEDTAEEACVDGQAQADYQANTAHSAFGNCKESAQDECPNWPGPPSSIMTKCLAQMWAEGPPEAGDNHWLNMSNKRYKKVACGFYQTPTGKWWATQDFY
jgi:hypothetical protein